MESKTTGLILAAVLFLFALWQFYILRRRSVQILLSRDRMDKELFVYLASQVTRRFKMNCLFAGAAIGMFGGLAIDFRAFPKLFIGIWLFVILFIGIALFLASVDFVAIKLHNKLEEDRLKIEQIGEEYRRKKEEVKK